MTDTAKSNVELAEHYKGLAIEALEKADEVAKRAPDGDTLRTLAAYYLEEIHVGRANVFATMANYHAVMHSVEPDKYHGSTGPR